MDPTEKNLSELLERLSSISLEKTDNQWSQTDTTPISSFTVSTNGGSGTFHPTYGAVPNVTIGSGIVSTTGTTTGVWTTTGTGTTIGTGSPGMWTTSPGYTVSSPNTQPGLHVTQNGKIHLQGDNADLLIGDKSMRAWMEKVEERLNILTPNPELEKEWDDLRRLGERYRKLEKKCKEKALMWKKLKSMPKPNINI